MKIIRGIKSLTSPKTGCVATIGNFDGLHLGHKKIIARLKEKASQLQLPLTVISFEPLPSEYFFAEPPARIYPLRDKVRELSKLGVDNFLCLKFNASFANMPPEVFIQCVLNERLNVKHLAVGDDFRFGYKRMGDFALLQKLGKKTGMTVEDTQTLEMHGERISSTRIRNALMQGDIKSSNELLGHSYQLSGRVRHGDKRGRTIGFPTLNIRVPENIAAQRGVYAIRAHGLSDLALSGVANLGSRPTVNGMENRLEAHLFNLDQDVYGRIVCIELVEYIRAEQRFDGLEELKGQIKEDMIQAKEILDKQST